MRYRPLGASGIQASVVGLGTWAMGGWLWGGTDEAAAVNAFHSSRCASSHSTTWNELGMSCPSATKLPSFPLMQLFYRTPGVVSNRVRIDSVPRILLYCQRQGPVIG
jgi:hypothetical protein